jgi:hypothetical protein
MTWKESLTRPGPQGHLVQFYGEEMVLARNVALYIKEGADLGERMIIVSTAAHAKLFREQLRAAGTPTEPLERDRRLQFLDAEETLASFLVDDEPDWIRFEEKVGGLVKETKALPETTGIRAFGEMVDILWKAGRLGAATRLEGFWNRLRRSEPMTLFCSYTVDVLAPGATSAELQELISTHSQLLPARSNGELGAAVKRAMIEVLGADTVEALLPLIRANVVSRVILPEGERTVLWLKRNLPPVAEKVLIRARAYYHEECVRSNHEGEK